MANKKAPSKREQVQKQPTRRAPADEQASRRDPEDTQALRRENIEKQAPRHNEMIHCDKCGEDYAATYKSCPFCNEPTTRRGPSGKRANNTRGGGYGAPVRPTQVLGVVISLVFIIAALFILFTKVGPLLFGGRDEPDSSAASSSASSSVDTSTQEPDVPPAPPMDVTGLQLSESDFTLPADQTHSIKVTVSPQEAAEYLTWTIDHPEALKVSSTGGVANVNTTPNTIKVTLTAVCGDKSVQCTIYCKGGSSGTAVPPGGSVVDPSAPVTPDKSNGGTTPDTGTAPSTTAGPNTPATIVNAENGLNIRSGPGSNYEVLASAENNAAIIFLEDSGNGWYKIDYGQGMIGYVSSEYVKIG